MADLKTTAEERARLREDSAPSGLHGRPSARTIRVLDDLDTLLAENERLRAVAVAARELVSESRRGGCSCTQRWRAEESTASSCACCDAERDVSTALAALEAP